jgi:hypothetical protein
MPDRDDSPGRDKRTCQEKLAAAKRELGDYRAALDFYARANFNYWRAQETLAKWKRGND